MELTEILAGLDRTIRNKEVLRERSGWAMQAFLDVNIAELRNIRTDVASAMAPTHRHIKSGRLYQLLGPARVQSDKPLHEMDVVQVYRGKELWVRETDEFTERFERV